MMLSTWRIFKESIRAGILAFRTTRRILSGSSSGAVSSPVYNIYVSGNIVDHDEFARELISSLDKVW